MSSKELTMYFGYGSNLWLEQMRQRCPTSRYLGIARLDNYRWIINERGYANVVQVSADAGATNPPVEDTVYGLVFSLQREDEARLDGNEGVPWAYTKELLAVNFWPAKRSDPPAAAETDAKPDEKTMLVYINRTQTNDNSAPKDEYIIRMNNGIRDAIAMGVPADYVSKVLRRWIPEQDPEGAREKAHKQALRFEDEN